MRTRNARARLALTAAVIMAGTASACAGADVRAADTTDHDQITTASLVAGHSGKQGRHPRPWKREQLATARATSAAYHRVEEAAADGYELPPAPAPLHECISAEDGPGAMGFHHINGEHASDTVLDPARPAALVYEPTRNGRLRLVALEYVVFADAWEEAHPNRAPRLFGRRLAYVPAGNRYDLPAFYQVHAWIWKWNPHGLHADHNPRVSCRFADRVG